MDDRQVFRFGSWAAILGGVLLLALNIVHPRPDSYPDPIANELQRVGASDAWIGIHLGIFAGLVLLTFGLFAIARSMKGGRAEGVARIALGSLLISTPVGLLAVLVDGYALKAIADGVAQDPATLPAATAVAHFAWGSFMGTAFLTAGLTPILFGWAVATDDGYPSWVGWVGILFGLGGIAAGLSGTYAGSNATFWALFTVSSGVLTVWTIGLGFLLGRRAPDAVTIPEGVTARTETRSRT